MFKHMGKDVIQNKIDKVRCIKLKPILQKGLRVKMTICLNEDANHFHSA